MLTSILRTIVPVAWGAVVTFLLSVIPALEPLRDTLLDYSDQIVFVVQGVVTGLWYVAWRYIEPRLPDWLRRIVLGGANEPNYVPDELPGT